MRKARVPKITAPIVALPVSEFRAAREHIALSQGEWADLLGIKREYVAKIEAGHEPSITVRRLASVYALLAKFEIPETDGILDVAATLEWKASKGEAET